VRHYILVVWPTLILGVQTSFGVVRYPFYCRQGVKIIRFLARLLFELVRLPLIGAYRIVGWRFYGALPDAKKFVVIAAPHTSNWDFPLMLAVALHFRVRLYWLGKKELFDGPLGWAMRALGGISVDRSKSGNVVTQMIETFDRAEKLALAIPPEGTRAKVRYWKTGFYNIAHGASAPIALGFLDYKRRLGGIGKTVKTTGDYERDLEEIKEFYAGVTGKYATRTDGGAG